MTTIQSKLSRAKKRKRVHNSNPGSESTSHQKHRFFQTQTRQAHEIVDLGRHIFGDGPEDWIFVPNVGSGTSSEPVHVQFYNISVSMGRIPEEVHKALQLFSPSWQYKNQKKIIAFILDECESNLTLEEFKREVVKHPQTPANSSPPEKPILSKNSTPVEPARKKRKPNSYYLPLLRNVGSKYNILKHEAYGKFYPSPKFDVIVETCAGGANYALRYIKRVKRVILFETHGKISAVWDWLINEASISDLERLPILETGTSITHRDDLQMAEKYLLGYNFNYRNVIDPYLTVQKNPFWNEETKESWIEILPLVKAKFEIAKLNGKFCGVRDIEEYLKRKGIRKATFFCDPPYQIVKGGYKGRNALFPYEVLRKYVVENRGQFILCEGALLRGRKFTIPD